MKSSQSVNTMSRDLNISTFCTLFVFETDMDCSRLVINRPKK